MLERINLSKEIYNLYCKGKGNKVYTCVHSYALGKKSLILSISCGSFACCTRQIAKGYKDILIRRDMQEDEFEQRENLDTSSDLYITKIEDLIEYPYIEITIESTIWVWLPFISKIIEVTYELHED